MLPFIAIGVAVIAAGSAAYKYYSKDDKSSKNTNIEKEEEKTHCLGGIAIWGRPNVGKTTFISQLVNKKLAANKVQTASKQVFDKIPAFRVDGENYSFQKIVDMPGNVDRLNEWLNQAQTNKHVFYIFNIEKLGDKVYMSTVSGDIVKTMEAMEKEHAKGAKLHVIASHVDRSIFKHFDQSNLVNEIMSSDDVRRLYEKLRGSVKGYFYGANLTDRADFENLLKNIVRDINA